MLHAASKKNAAEVWDIWLRISPRFLQRDGFHGSGTMMNSMQGYRGQLLASSVRAIVSKCALTTFRQGKELSSMSRAPRRCIRAFVVLGIGLCAIAYVLDNGEVVLTRVLWATFSLRAPVASAFHTLRVANQTQYPLLVHVQSLNDRDFALYTAHQRYTRQRLLKSLDRECILAPLQTRSFEIPSEEDPRISLLLLTVMTRVENPGVKGARQRVALYLLWPGPPRQKGDLHVPESESRLVQISEGDLFTLDLESIEGTRSFNFTRAKTWVPEPY